MDAGRDDRLVEGGHLPEGLRAVAGDDLEDFREGMLLVARVDALRAVADVEVLPPP